MKRPTLFLLFAAALAVLAIATYTYFVPRQYVSKVMMEVQPEPEPETEAASFAPPPPPTPEEIKAAAVLTPEFEDPNGGPPIMPAIPLEQGELPWEAQLRLVRDAPNLSDAERARRLFALLPGLAVEGRETAAEQAVSLVKNADYDVAKPVLLNPGTYGPALNVLFADLAERPPEIQLPTLLQIARIQQHPFAPNARENLELFLGADYGADWNRWDAAIRASLAAKK
jgi:hypothetical protein